MPRGFLVKRSKKPGAASYRIKDGETDHREECPVPLVLHNIPRPCASWWETPIPERARFPQQPQLERNSSSPVQAASFPDPEPSPIPTSTCLGQPGPNQGSACGSEAKQTCNKRAKPSDITTSPVLGLRITEEEEEEDGELKLRPHTPLGGFMCQLCRRSYPDPPALAQHRCARIVRVDYRCPECGKAFSCPANLASHRRWHKPRHQHAAREGQGEERKRRKEEEEEAAFTCPLCAKTFRRRAYLRKHAALHGRPHPPPGALSSLSYTCRFCPHTFSTSPALTRHINKCHPAETHRVILLPPNSP